MGTILMLVVWYEVFMVLFTLVSATVWTWWARHTFGERICCSYFERLHEAYKAAANPRLWVSWPVISYLMFWPVVMIFRLNALVEDIVAFAADSQDEEN